MLLLLRAFVKQLIVPLCLCYASILQAQSHSPGNYHFAHIDGNQGLSNNQVNCIYKDKKGFMWFGTMSGLNRYDGYVFKTYRHSAKDTTSLADDYISKIAEGPSGKLWVLGRTGYNIYDPETNKFNRRADACLQQLELPVRGGLINIIKAAQGYWFVYRDSGIYYVESNKPVVALRPGTSLKAGTVAAVQPDAKNNLWIVYGNGWIEKIDAATKKITYRTDILQKKLGNNLADFELYVGLYIDAQDELWVHADGIFNGIYRINIKENTLQQIAKDQGIAVLSSNIIVNIVEDDRGLLWISTDHGGLNILNKKTMAVQVLLNQPGNDNSLSHNSLTQLYKDDLGIIWIGTYKQGINYFHEGIIHFPLYRHREWDHSSLPFNDVNRFVEDAKGNIWIGSNGGGLIYFDRSNHSFKQFRHNPANENSLTNDVVVSLCIDHNNILWIGTYYGGLDSYDGKTFKHHRHNNKDSNSIADDRVWEIYEDGNRNLWIGTLGAGLERYDREHHRFIHYKPFAPHSIFDGYVSTITEDAGGRLWVGTSYGINVWDSKAGAFQLLLNNNTQLSNDNIISVLRDSRGLMWVGTRDGLNVYDSQNKRFRVFRKEDGLPDNTILNIIEDKEQHLWVSTPNGISHISYKGLFKDSIRISCINYDRLNGLQGKEFNENAALTTSRGDIIFGGANGFNLFNPAHVKINTYTQPVILTGLQVFNQNIEAGDTINNQVVLTKSITETDEIILRYDENIFSLEFAALSYINPGKTQYAYRLEGFNDHWLFTDGHSRKVTYTNLDPGQYMFYVKASNDNEVWNEKALAVKIIVLPPFWKTPWAYGIYVLVAMVILYFARRIVMHQAKMKFALEQERKEALRMHELDVMKIRFFTNVSHEFRTPLSLILTPLERMIKASAEPSMQPQYQLIYRNARRLLNLVNQLLDFRKMEVHELKLHAAEGDIAQFIKESATSFTDIAEKKQIRFSFTSSLESLHTIFDHDKLERIVFNLLSNAFKFTLEKGTVAVHVSAIREAGKTMLAIKVTDTGIGIPAGRKEKIFERFFQHDVPGTMINQGSGIGLAITKEFVHLMNGTINVESTENKGSCFTVLLPVKEVTPSAVTTEQPEAVSIMEEETDLVPGGAGTGDKKKSTLLLVEDNEDFLFYLKDNLREYFNIAEAVDGKDGWQKALAMHPDMVVSDVNMPRMNGIDLCKKIKQDPRTKHIPVVLLTALTDEEQQLRSLEIGASDYVTKPFNFEILLSRIRNLLVQQQSLRQTFTKQVAVRTTEIQISSPDEKFIQDALAIAEKNISNPDFSVEDLSRALFLSRAAVYRRIFVLTGQTPVEFIRSVRLQRAAQLLQQSKMTVAEIAYETGFNNPKYFSRYFKLQFGVNPSAYRLNQD